MRCVLFLVTCANALINFRTEIVPHAYPFHTIEMSPFHPSIHTLSNIGEGGEMHAAGAKFVTRMIDFMAYDGRNIRAAIANDLALRFDPQSTKVVDIGCSVGAFTECLWRANFRRVCALDSSVEMLTLAEKLLSPKVEILLGNAAQELPAADLFVCGFVMHELPYIARQAIIDNAYEGLSTGGLFLIVDISNSYVPKEMMLKGEPFVTEYLENFVGQLLMSPFRVESKTWIEGHVATYWCWKDGHSLDEASKNIW